MKRSTVTFAILFAIVAATPTAIRSHWLYPNECCDGKDCWPVDAEYLGDSILLKWGKEKALVPRDYSVRPSPDRRYHFCGYKDGASGEWKPRCVFAPGTS